MSHVVLAITVGALYAAGVYLLLRRSVIRVLVGLILLGHGATLLIFVASGPSRSGVPIVGEGAQALAPGAPDPLPQALILTAIVIGLAVVSYAAVLVRRVVSVAGTDDTEQLGQLATSEDASEVRP